MVSLRHFALLPIVFGLVYQTLNFNYESELPSDWPYWECEEGFEDFASPEVAEVSHWLKRYTTWHHHPEDGWFLFKYDLQNWRHFLQNDDLYDVNEFGFWPVLKGVDVDAENLGWFNAPSRDPLTFLSQMCNANIFGIRLKDVTPKMWFIPEWVYHLRPELRLPTIENSIVLRDTFLRLYGARWGSPRYFVDKEELLERYAVANATGDCLEATALKMKTARLAFVNNENELAIKLLLEECYDSCYYPGMKCDDPDNKLNYAAALRRLISANYLRTGERDNCEAGHSHQSCLMPLEGMGIHKLPDGASNAIKWFLIELERNPDDKDAMWLLNLAHQQLGTWPEGVPEQWRIGREVFKNDYDIGYWPQVAGGLGLDYHGKAGAVMAEDLDGDNNLDVMQCSQVQWYCGEHISYSKNNGDGTYKKNMKEAGIVGLNNVGNFKAADYDNDGDLDVYMTRAGWIGIADQPTSLIQNNGDGTFNEVSVKANARTFGGSHSATWADYDLDGHVDVYVANEQNPCLLLHNNGDGTFTDVAYAMGVTECGWVKGVAFGDANGDGYADLMVSRFGDENSLWLNQGGKSFVDVAAEAGVQRDPAGSFSIAWFDFNQDGKQDVFIHSTVGFANAEIYAGYTKTPFPKQDEYMKEVYKTADGGRTHYFINTGNNAAGIPIFRDASEELGYAERTMNTMGFEHGDLDNDGWPDVYFGCGNPNIHVLQPNLMLRNNKGQNFQDVTWGNFGHLQKGHGISFADIDNDGDQDVLASLGAMQPGDAFFDAVFLNPGHGNHFITIKLEGGMREDSKGDGSLANRAALMATIEIGIQENGKLRKIYQTADGGSSFGSRPLRQEIGVAKAEVLDYIKVTWPAKGFPTSEFKNVKSDQFIKISQGAADYEVLDVTKIVHNVDDLIAKGNHHHHHH